MRYSASKRLLFTAFVNGACLISVGISVLFKIFFTLNVGNCIFFLYIYVVYLDTWSGFEAANPAPWPSRGLHHLGKFVEP